MEIILCTMGTGGDIFPFLGIAKELIRRGYQTTILTNENWEKDVVEIGAAFFPIAPEDPSQSQRDDNAFFTKCTLPSFLTSFRYVSNLIPQSRELVLVYRANMLGMESAAEKYNLPHIKIALQPSAIKSFDRPPWPLTSIANGRLAKPISRVIISLIYYAVELARGHSRESNGFRRSVGLSPLQLGRIGPRTEAATILLSPSWFASPADDWPANCRCTGFIFHDKSGEDPELDSFIDAHGAPIVFTPGTGVSNVHGFFQKAASVCATIGVPGVFLSRHFAAGEFAPGVPILHRNFADLSRLLPRSKLLVHHGGIGTTAQALRAGIPQIILPDRFDQPDNAIRIAKLGVGAAILKDNQSPDKWASLISHLTSNSNIDSRLLKISKAIGKQRPTEGVCDIIEKIAAIHYKVDEFAKHR